MPRLILLVMFLKVLAGGIRELESDNPFCLRFCDDVKTRCVRDCERSDGCQQKGFLTGEPRERVARSTFC